MFVLNSVNYKKKIAVIFSIIGNKDKEEILSVKRWANTNLRLTEFFRDLLEFLI